MKLALALLATATSAMAATTIDATASVAADSKFGMDLLSKARRVEEGDDAADVDATWISGFALKFQGCHHVAQYNPDAEDEEDVKIITKRLIRFRLCPVEYCSASSGGGCRSGYGDYIVDMDTFAGSYLENKAEQEESNCESYKENSCNCYYADDEEACIDQCYADAGMTECYDEVDGNGDVVEKFDPLNYYACAQYEFPEQNDAYYRKLEDAGDDEDMEYYMGAYCSDEGSKVVLGLFTDDACTNFSDDYGGRKTYSSLSGGESMPYSQTSIIDTGCYSCAVEQDANGRKLEEVEVSEACEAIYEPAGKCESNLSYGTSSYPNEAGCDYMEGIKITRSNGIVIAGANSANAVANTFIGLFSVSFVLLGSYVYYLKTKLDRGRINLSD